MNDFLTDLQNIQSGIIVDDSDILNSTSNNSESNGFSGRLVEESLKISSKIITYSTENEDD